MWQNCASCPNDNFDFSDGNPHFLLQIRISRKISWIVNPQPIFLAAHNLLSERADTQPWYCAKKWMLANPKCAAWNFIIFRRRLTWCYAFFSFDSVFIKIMTEFRLFAYKKSSFQACLHMTFCYFPFPFTHSFTTTLGDLEKGGKGNEILQNFMRQHTWKHEFFT